MESLNQIEKLISDKASNELREIVTLYMSQIEKLNEKYKVVTNFNYLSKQDRFDSGCLRNSELSTVLHNSLKERFLKKMVKVKSSELMNNMLYLEWN
mgnify:CR=1 FL=1|tara:strand:+ start:138 stop:428 length:291 start_codon:yes stop_codon:yes gene_type:complete